MRLAHPEALVLLLLLVPLAVLAFHGRPAYVLHATAARPGLVRESAAARLYRLLPWLRLLVLALAVLAVARPQWGVQATKITREGIAIALVVDISSSMGATDLAIDGREVNRLEVVKRALREFVTGRSVQAAGARPDGGASDEAEPTAREGDAIGMVTFARYADAVGPLTLDHNALLGLLENVRIVQLPSEDGTAVGDGVVAGIEMLRRAAGKSKVMILLTDGSNNAGNAEPLHAAQLAKAVGVKVYTVGAGSRGVAKMPVRNRTGDYQSFMVPVYIDEDTLQKIAVTTGGRYFRATDGEGVRSIYAEIDRLETAPNLAEHYQEYIEAFPLVVGLALTLLLAELVLTTTRLRTVP